MKQVEVLAQFVKSAHYDQLLEPVLSALKIHTLDSLGCAIGALLGTFQDTPIKLLQRQLDDFGGSPLVTLIGGGKTAPDRAAFFNSTLIRYLDYNDSFLAKKETCHPSDNLAAILSACEYHKGTGKDFLVALAVAYQVQCRLSEEAPVRDKGFDHTTQGAYSVAAGVSKALNLTAEQTAYALAIAAVPNNALRVTRTGTLSHWKGLAFPNTAFSATHAAFLAYRGITGPLEVFEGNKGLMESITGPFTMDWPSEKLDIIMRCILKKYNAEIHSQSAIEGILELREAHKVPSHQIERIDVEIFDVAFNIIGGGEEGEKKEIHTKEEADHSLPYMLAAAYLDGEVTPRQYLPKRIESLDIQSLLRKIYIYPNKELSRRFPQEMCCKIQLTTQQGQSFTKEKNDYEGFTTRPMSWARAVEKFNSLTQHLIEDRLRIALIEHIHTLETHNIDILTNLLAQVGLKKGKQS